MRFHLVLLIFPFLSIGCFDDDASDYCYRDIVYELYASTDGPSDSLVINSDTIWWEFTIDSLVKDKNTGDSIDLFTYNVFDNWTILPYEVNPTTESTINALNDFHYIADIGSFERANRGRLFLKFDNFLLKKKIRIGFVPKRRGIFVIGLYARTYDRFAIDIENPMNGCYIHNATPEVYINKFSSLGNNYHLVEDFPELVGFEENFMIGGDFAIKVVD